MGIGGEGGLKRNKHRGRWCDEQHGLSHAAWVSWGGSGGGVIEEHMDS